MATQSSTDSQLCERLKTLGYSERKRIRMYGEEFDLTSNPVPSGKGFAIQAVSTKSGSSRQLQIPLSVLQMITKDIANRNRRAA